MLEILIYSFMYMNIDSAECHYVNSRTFFVAY